MNEDNLMERPYVDMTMGWIKRAGGEVSHDNYDVFTVPGGQKYKGFNGRHPGRLGQLGLSHGGRRHHRLQGDLRGHGPRDSPVNGPIPTSSRRWAAR